MLYTGNELKKVLRQLIIFAVIDLLILICGGIAAFYISLNIDKYTGTAIVGATVFCFIFVLGNFVLPVLHYYKFLMAIFTGRYSQRQGTVRTVGEKPVYKDNKNYFYELDIDLGDNKCALYLYDANLGVPEYKPGDLLTITAYENIMVKVEMN